MVKISGTRTVDDGNGHACLWQSGVPHDLGTLGGRISQAVDINESGTIIGWSEVTGQSLPHPFVYANSQMRDLNELIDPASDWMLSVATGINDVGQIVGAGYHDNGSMHAFLLTPIPEPATLSLLAIGGLAVIRGRRR